jgi:hypothetical protein
VAVGAAWRRWQQGGGAGDSAAAAAAASRRQRGVSGGTNNQQSTKSIDYSGDGNGDDDSDDDDNGNEGDGGNLLLATPPPPPTPRYRQAAAAAAKLAAAANRQRGVSGGTNNQQSTKSIDCSGDGAAKLAAAYALPPRFRCRRRLRQDGRRRQRGLRTAQSTTNHCLSVGFVGIDGGCEHYLPFHQPQSDDFMPDANDQQIWLIASPVAQPPPIRLVPLHPNTMGDAANVQFCQNHWWGG